MLTIDALEALGADTKTGLSRCLDNADFYLKLVRMAVGQQEFDELYYAIDKNDLARAFTAAHALKGVLANLSLDFILKPVMEITELLRDRTETDYSALVGAIREKQESLKKLCEEA